eukprot:gnl/TRDRNA2_/TRDRNA2_131644_c5_seq1.p1 gnl/TRDRNA2_/TRDRNA2_131644_c5~~gnl/TRDRNA2_/TRDRNA2_131644_c5_seq1.p1  ORF type:complete len:169 (-),score=37.54 gnl/TRDRNA2_/TRDRNA2_131644_c5_seq1:342-806(-)
MDVQQLLFKVRSAERHQRKWEQRLTEKLDKLTDLVLVDNRIREHSSLASEACTQAMVRDKKRLELRASPTPTPRSPPAKLPGSSPSPTPRLLPAKLPEPAELPDMTAFDGLPRDSYVKSCEQQSSSKWRVTSPGAQEKCQTHLYEGQGDNYASI